MFGYIGGIITNADQGTVLTFETDENQGTINGWRQRRQEREPGSAPQDPTPRGIAPCCSRRTVRL